MSCRPGSEQMLEKAEPSQGIRAEWEGGREDTGLALLSSQG